MTADNMPTPVGEVQGIGSLRTVAWFSTEPPVGTKLYTEEQASAYAEQQTAELKEDYGKLIALHMELKAVNLRHE